MGPEIIQGVLFDFHRTLVDGGEAHTSLNAAWARSGRGGSPLAALGAERYEALARRVYRLDL